MHIKLPFTKGKDLIGLDIGSHSIKLLELGRKRGRWQLKRLGMASLNKEAIVDGSIVDPMMVSDAIKELIEKVGVKKKTKVVLALDSHSVIIKKLSLPQMREDELSESILDFVEEYIPFPLKDVNIDFQIVGVHTEEDGLMDVVMAAVKKEVVNNHVRIVRDAALEVAVVDVDVFALENAVEINYNIPPNENIAIVNVGASNTGLSIISGGITVLTTAVPMGGNYFIEGIQKDMNINSLDAESVKLGREVEGIDMSKVKKIVEGLSDRLAVEIKRSIDFFLGGGEALYLSKIYLTGGGSMIEGLPGLIQEQTSISVEMMNPFRNIVYNPGRFKETYLNEVAPYFAVATGLAMRRLGDT